MKNIKLNFPINFDKKINTNTNNILFVDKSKSEDNNKTFKEIENILIKNDQNKALEVLLKKYEKYDKEKFYPLYVIFLKYWVLIASYLNMV